MKNFSKFIKNFLEYVTRYPKTTITICFMITAVFATQLPKLTLDASIKGLFPPNFPAKLEIDKLEEVFGGSEIVLLGIETKNIYEKEVLEVIQRLTEEIEEFEEVDDVVSLFTVNDIVGTEEGMEVSDLIEEIPETEEDIQALRSRMRANELFWNNIISEDETATAIVATITAEAKDDAVYEKFQAIVEREIATQDGRHLEGGAHLTSEDGTHRPPLKFYLGGMPITRALMAINMQKDMKKFFPAGLLLMILLLYFSFKSLRGILLPFSVVIMSLICTFGLMGFLGKPITLTGIILPAMLIAIANDYSIHIVARYYEDVKASMRSTHPCPSQADSGLTGNEPTPDPSQERNNTPLLPSRGNTPLPPSRGDFTQAITVRVMNRLGIPILLAGVTTVIGFSSLLTHIMPPAKDLGIFASFGIILAFLFSITFAPAWLSLLPIPKILAKGKRKERLGNILQTISLFITKHPATSKLLVVVGICIAIASATGIPKIIVDTNPINYYKEDYPLVVSTNLLNAKLGGAMTVDVVFDGDIKDPSVLAKIQEVQEYMDSLPQIGKTLAMVDYLKEMNQAMHADDPAYHAIPETRELVAQYLLLYSMSGDPEDFDRVVDYEYRKGHLIGRVNVTGTTEIAETVGKIETYISEHFATVDTPKVESITGFSILFKELIPLVVQGQMRSLLISLVVIFVLGALAFRSLIAGLFTIYPISVAMLIVFGLMGYSGIELNITTAMLSSILIGVGVDYTIHFLYHYREEVQQAGLSPHDALRVTLTTSGKGIIYNALSVVVGFCILMLSEFLPIYFFGWLLTFSIIACLIGALTLLPAAVLAFKPKFIFGGAQKVSVLRKRRKRVMIS